MTGAVSTHGKIISLFVSLAPRCPRFNELHWFDVSSSGNSLKSPTENSCEEFR